jgi:hypothetical protein
MKMGNGCVALYGDRIWKKSKEIKQKLVSRIAPLWPVPVPSGWKNKDCLDLVRKKDWFASQVTKLRSCHN